MKLESIKRLHQVKKTLVREGNHCELIEEINSVLLHENGIGAVLYPYNNLKEQIENLQREGMPTEAIILKVGLEGIVKV